MAAPLHRLTERSVPPFPIDIQGGFGTELFVLHKNLKVADTLDPYAAFTNPAGSLNVVPVGAPAARFLQLFLYCWANAALPSPLLTQAPKVLVYGHIPGNEAPSTLYPSQINAGFPVNPHETMGGGHFIPLFDAATLDNPVAFGTATHVAKTSTAGSSNRTALIRGRTIAIDGVRNVVTLVETAAIGGAGVQDIILLGRFTS
jgi:hypothetical protein